MGGCCSYSSDSTQNQQQQPQSHRASLVGPATALPAPRGIFLSQSLTSSSDRESIGSIRDGVASLLGGSRRSSVAGTPERTPPPERIRLSIVETAEIGVNNGDANGSLRVFETLESNNRTTVDENQSLTDPGGINHTNLFDPSPLACNSNGDVFYSWSYSPTSGVFDAVPEDAVLYVGPPDGPMHRADPDEYPPLVHHQSNTSHGCGNTSWPQPLDAQSTEAVHNFSSLNPSPSPRYSASGRARSRSPLGFGSSHGECYSESGSECGRSPEVENPLGVPVDRRTIRDRRERQQWEVQQRSTILAPPGQQSPRSNPPRHNMQSAIPSPPHFSPTHSEVEFQEGDSVGSVSSEGSLGRGFTTPPAHNGQSNCGQASRRQNANSSSPGPRWLTLQEMLEHNENYARRQREQQRLGITYAPTLVTTNTNDASTAAGAGAEWRNQKVRDFLQHLQRSQRARDTMREISGRPSEEMSNDGVSPPSKGIF